MPSISGGNEYTKKVKNIEPAHLIWDIFVKRLNKNHIGVRFKHKKYAEP